MCREGVHFIPGHPIAGTEYSGPESGFAELFDGRWTILTPLPGADEHAVAKLKAFWEACGAQVEIMTPDHHDLVLAVTSHVPHLIAYNIVGTVTRPGARHRKRSHQVLGLGLPRLHPHRRLRPDHVARHLHEQQGGGAGNPGPLHRRLGSLQKAIRWGDGDTLFDLFTRTRAVRRGIIDARQDTAAPDFGRKTAQRQTGAEAERLGRRSARSFPR